MSQVPTVLEVRGLAKGRLRQLEKKASRLGLAPEDYVKRLIEEDLELDREARENSFDQILGPGRETAVTDEELDRLVDRARSRHHKKRAKRKG